MKLDGIVATLHERFVETLMHKRAVQKATEAEAREILQLINEVKKHGNQVGEFKEYDSFMYRNWEGVNVWMGHRQASQEERLLRVSIHRNRQFQFLLSEAFEEFERFLKRFYAWACERDSSLWKRAFAKGEDPSGMTFDWFALNLQRRQPQAILTAIRAQAPLLGRYESANPVQTDYRLLAVLVEKLRHHIVHAGGCVVSREAFAADVLSSVGRSNNGKLTDADLQIIYRYLGSGEYSQTIVLEDLSRSFQGLTMKQARLDYLVESMAAYTELITTAVIERLYEQPPT